MNRRRWFAGKRAAAWCRELLLLLLAAALCVNLWGSAADTLRETEASATGGRAAAESGDISEREEPGDVKTVALTFDDGPHPVYTPRLLEGLRQRNVRASFFLIGQNIDGNEDIVRQMYEDGHLIGNHSQSHVQLTAESARAACDQIACVNAKIRAITGETPGYVRPPFGSWSQELESMLPMTVALWNLDPLDWKSQDRSAVVRYVLSHVEDGSIILLHDVYESSVEAALEIIDTLAAEGYNFVTVDEMLIE